MPIISIIKETCISTLLQAAPLSPRRAVYEADQSPPTITSTSQSRIIVCTTLSGAIYVSLVPATTRLARENRIIMAIDRSTINHTFGTQRNGSC